MTEHEHKKALKRAEFLMQKEEKTPLTKKEAEELSRLIDDIEFFEANWLD